MFAAWNSHHPKSVHQRKHWHCKHFSADCWDEKQRWAAERSAVSVVSCVSAAARERLKMPQCQPGSSVTILQQCRQDENGELLIYFLAVVSKSFLWVGSLRWGELLRSILRAAQAKWWELTPEDSEVLRGGGWPKPTSFYISLSQVWLALDHINSWMVNCTPLIVLNGNHVCDTTMLRSTAGA